VALKVVIAIVVKHVISNSELDNSTRICITSWM